jgi:hypothetical protein
MNENMQNILGYKIPISDLPFLKERKGNTQKPKEDSAPTTLKGKEKVSEGPKKSKEPKEVPKTVKKLLADAQWIRAEQEAKAKKVAEKKKTAELKAAEKPAKKSKAFQERPQSGRESERESVRKKPRIEVARSYLKSIGSAVKGIPIRAEPLAVTASECLPQSTEKKAVLQHPPLGEVPVLRDEDMPSTEPVVGMTASECLPQSTEKEAVPQHPSLGEVPILRDEDILSTEPVGQDVTLPSMVGEGVAQTVLSETDSILPELLNAREKAEIEPLRISHPRGDAEVGGDTGSIQVEAESSVAGPSIRPIVCPMAERAEPSSSRPFVELGTEEDGPGKGPTRDSVGFFRPAREYEFDEASLEKRLAGPIMDAVRALTPADYLGQSTVGCILTEDMIASLVRLQTMVSL